MIAQVEAALAELLSGTRPARLHDAMRHAVTSGGKRIRPRLCLAAAEAAGGEARDAVLPACAIELLHAYTLVHDDLPAMDNDEMRRGQPTVWRKYGEDVAILAGDSLQSLAFSAAVRAPRNAGAIVAELAKAGVDVVCGQTEDLDGDDTDYIYLNKTAALFSAAAAMGGLAAGATPEQVESLRVYATNIGLAFQHEDDLLDGDSPLSEEEAKRRIAAHTSAALEALAKLPGNTRPLEELAKKLVDRKA